LLNGSSVT